MNRKPYPTDLSAEEWELIEPLLPPPNPIGSPRQVSLREILVAMIRLMLRSLTNNQRSWLSS